MLAKGIVSVELPINKLFWAWKINSETSWIAIVHERFDDGNYHVSHCSKLSEPTAEGDCYGNPDDETGSCALISRYELTTIDEALEAGVPREWLFSVLDPKDIVKWRKNSSE